MKKVDFQTMGAGTPVLLPYRSETASLQLWNYSGSPLVSTEIVQLSGFSGLNASWKSRIEFSAPANFVLLALACGAAVPNARFYAPDGALLAAITRPKSSLGLCDIGYVAQEIAAVELDWPSNEGVILTLTFDDAGTRREAIPVDGPITEITCSGIVFAETASLRSAAAAEVASAREFVAGVAYARQGQGVAKPKIPTAEDLKNPIIKREWDLCLKAAKDAAGADVGNCRHFVIWPLDDKGEGPATDPKMSASWPYTEKAKITKKYGPFKNSVHPVGDAIHVIKYCGVA
jgi:hypothetical protein